MWQHYENTHEKVLAISVALEAVLAAFSGYILYSHPEHSYFFIAAIFYFPGYLAGLCAIELLKSNISSFNLLFSISVALSVFLQVLIIAWVITVFQEWKVMIRLSFLVKRIISVFLHDKP